MNKILSNKEKIKAYLEDGLKLSRVEAMKLGYGMDLPQRIHELRQDGLNIDDEPLIPGSKQKRYFINKTDIND